MANKPNPADFSPTVPDFPVIDQYQPIYGKFDLTTYIQGASDYEIMAFLVQCYNATLKGYGEVTQLSKDSVTAYNQLQTWVNTWFNNLDVKQDIDAKLEQMLVDGELAAVIASSDAMIPAVDNYFASEDGNATLSNKTSEKINNMAANGTLADIVKETNQVKPAVTQYLNTVDGSEKLSNATAEKINSMAANGTLADIVKKTAQVPRAVVQYLNTVDGSEKLSNATAEKINNMATTGELGTVISGATDLQKTTTDWLRDNVTPVGSAVVVDKSLTIEGAAADSKATGNSIDSLKSYLSHIDKLSGVQKYVGYGLSSEDGSVSQVRFYTTSDFIHVIPHASYKLYMDVIDHDDSYPRIALYTNSKTFIKRIDRVYDITIPNNCYYIRFMTLRNVYESAKLYIYDETLFAKYNKTTNDLTDLKYNAIVKNTIYSNGNFIFGHIRDSGEIVYNFNKNICFEKPVLALRGSTVSVDSGYKYQMGFYDSNMKFLKRIEWKTEPYTFDEDRYVIIELSDIEESTLYDTGIEQYIHYKLIASIPIYYDELKKMFDKEIKFINGGNITLAYDIGSVVDLTPQNIPSYRYAIIECEYNDVFLLNVKGGINPRAWGFVDKNNVLLSVAGSNTSANNILVYAPINSAKLIINDNNTSKECFKVGRVSQNTHEIKSVSNDISIINAENNKNLLYQFDNIINMFGYDFVQAIGKVFTVTGESGYNSWPFLGNANGVLVCLYSKGTHHVDNASNVFYKTSHNAIIWSAEKKFINNYGTRTNVTGKGNDSNGNLLFWVRSGSVGGDSNTFTLFRTEDGNTFEKVSSPIFTIKAGHIGDIAFVENMGLVAFYNTYHGSINSYGYVLSKDNGITWEQHEIGRTDSFNDCPTEISFVNLGSGKILAMGRSEISSPMYQIESSDNGNTWNTSVTNITDVGGSTPNLILDNEYISVYYYDRRNGKLKVIKSKATDVFENPTNWGESSVLANGTMGQDAGNVNATIFNNHHVVSYYSGNENTTKVYTVIN